MAEIKNTFLQSKMNKDKDGRILPNGQYRDALNVQISKSEGEDVGALENVLGNVEAIDWIETVGLVGDNLTSIGSLFDDNSNTIYLFVTNYTDSSFTQTNSAISASAVYNYILSYNANTNQGKILVNGNFLNFSKTSLITGVDLIENLLFWTDDRNQPRKIDLNLAQNNYYDNEDKVSVAKYYPYSSPLLLEFEDFPNYYQSTMKDVVSEYLPANAAAKIIDIDTTVNFHVGLQGNFTNIKPESSGTVLKNGSLVTGANIGPKVTVKDVGFPGTGAGSLGPITYITFNVDGVSVLEFLESLKVGNILYFHFPNPEYNVNWPGDPDFLQDKFARFSYRFTFDTNENSLIAPFTQLAYVPKQDGYFIGYDANVQEETSEEEELKGTLIGDESAAFDTTIVGFMENKINSIKIGLLAPTKGNLSDPILWQDVVSQLHVKSIDILYKAAESNQISIVETIPAKNFASLSSSSGGKVLFYDYQGKNAWKTLPASDTTRVFDAVPIKAKSQAVSGNRVIYGNFIDKHSSPTNLNYVLQIAEKRPLPTTANPSSTRLNSDNYVRKEYQNHTLKQNRTYQVGLVLSDRYGRPSNVILSNVRENSISSNLKGSTIFHDYKNIEDPIILDKTNTLGTDPTTWAGDMMYITFNQVIPKLANNSGYPGVYSVNDGKLASVLFSKATPLPPNPGGGTICNYTIDILASIPAFVGAPVPTASINISIDGTTGDIIEYEVVSSSDGWENGMPWSVDWGLTPTFPPCDFYIGKSITGAAITALDNPLGWYSYKIVVKQQQQEYYNVYLPGSLAGYPCNQISGVEGIDNNEPLTVSQTTEDGLVGSDTTTTQQEYGNIKATNYPVGEYKKTSHIVLFGDNINKVPRDLQEVGPTQGEFRSSERLFPRVESFLLPVGANWTYSSQQYVSPRSGDKVISIGSMTDLGLGDLDTNPNSPVIPNLFYKGEINPLIGRISTTNQYGIQIGDESSGNSCSVNTGEILGEIDGAGSPTTYQTAANSRFAYGPTLSVMETKPVESLIDIFWETTTSGLINQLNFDIENSDNTIPTSINAEISWSEEDNYGKIISNTFQAFGSGNNPLGGQCQIELISVLDGVGANRVDQFDMIEVSPGQYEIKIAAYDNVTNRNFISTGNPFLGNSYTFSFNVIDTNTGDSFTIDVDGNLFNRTPIERMSPNRDDLKELICSSSYQLNVLEQESSTNQYTISIAQRMELSTGTESKMGWNSIYQDCYGFLNRFSGKFALSGYPFIDIGAGMQNSDSMESEFNFAQGARGYISASSSDKFSPVHGGGYSIGKLNVSDGVNPAMGLDVTGATAGVQGGWIDLLESAPNTPGAWTYGYPRAWGRGDNNNNWGYWEDLVDNLIDCGSNDNKWCGTNGKNIEQKQWTYKEEFDGFWKVANGTYGTLASEPSPFYGQTATNNPNSNGLGSEIVWTIPRMYQVSMYIPFTEWTAELGEYPSYFLGYTGLNSSQFNAQTSTGEVVFGLYQDLIGDPGAPEPGLPNGRAPWLKYLPDSPIYWADNTQQLSSTNGESVVGSLYNKRGDANFPALDYPHHYWPDLNSIIQNAAGAGDVYKNWRQDPSGNPTPKLMQLQNGANSFYQHSEYFSELGERIESGSLLWDQMAGTCFDPTAVAGGFVTTCDGQPGQPTGASQNFQPNAGVINGALLNARGYSCWTHGIDPVTKLGPANSASKFYPVPSGLDSNGFSQARIHAGNPNASPALGNLNGNNYLGQNGIDAVLPGGRYIVTLRATDKNGSSDGLFWEWDIPIQIPVWRYRQNGYAMCTNSTAYSIYSLNSFGGL